MQLRSFYNPTTSTVALQRANDAVLGGEWEELGTVEHTETSDNLRGMQNTSTNHAVYSHIQEQLYLQYGIQDMQVIDIIYAGSLDPVERFWVTTSANTVRPQQEVTLKALVEPAGSNLDDFYVKASNPDLVDITTEAGGEFKVKFNGPGQVTVRIGIKNTNHRQEVSLEARGTPAAAIS